MGWIGLIWLRIGTSEHGNEPLGSIKCWGVLEQLCNWQLIKKGSALSIQPECAFTRGQRQNPVSKILFK
jgi:hypothetical protein